MWSHFKVRTSKEYADKAWCDYCHRPFSREHSTLSRHIERHHKDEQQCGCTSHCLRNTVKKEYDPWLRLSEIRSVDVMASLDPLEWCKMHNTQFPTIAKLARKYLAIPASSAPSKSGEFSRAKLIQQRQR